MFYDEIAKQNKEAVNWNKRLWNAINNPKPVKCTDCRYMGKINGKYGNCKELRSKHNVTSVRECIWFEKSIKISTDKFKADYALHNKAYRQSNNNQISKVNNSKENHIADMGELVSQSNNNQINHPKHYTQGKIETWDFIRDKGLNFHRGNVIKYLVRAGLKDKAKELEDLKKAMAYLQNEINNLGGK